MPTMTAVGGNIRYPTLQGICDLFRASINDTFPNNAGAGTGSGGGAGLINPNSNPDLLSYLNAACLDTFAELRTVGSPELILDNYLIEGLPALSSPDPTIQVGLGYAGFFDGVQWHSQWTLPIGMSRLLALAQRQTNMNQDFQPMMHFPAGIPAVEQGRLMSGWEIRQGILWMNGATTQIDLRIRCRITFPPFLAQAAQVIDFSTAYVPILDSLNAIEAKMRKRYATRFAPEIKADAIADDREFMGKLRLETIRERQSAESTREEFGNEAVQDFAIAWSWL